MFNPDCAFESDLRFEGPGKSKMKIGVFGGTFDPIHMAHLLLAETARAAQQLDEVWFIPAFSPPQKQGKQISSPRDRLEMVKLAIAGHVNFRVSKIEIERKGTSFTVETLRQIAAAHPEDELFLIIGGDSLSDFLTWRDPAEILNLATVIAVNRGRSELSIEPIIAELGEKYRSRFHLCQMPPTDISSSEIRQRVAEGQTIRYQTPRSVEMYIGTHKLYQAES